MVVDEHDLIGMAIDPLETDAPLIIHVNAVLSGAIAAELFHPIATRDTEIVKPQRTVNVSQLATLLRSPFLGDQPMSSSSVPAPSIVCLGLDVHKDSLTIAVLPADAPAPTRIDRYPAEFGKLRRVFDRLAQGGALRACYEDQ